MNSSMESSSGVDRKYLSGKSIWALAFGCVIGWGSVLMPGTTFLPKAGPLGSTIGIIISAILILIVCYNYSFLARMYPEAEGSYYFTKTVLGEDHGFLAGWSLVLTYISIFWANATAFAVIGRYFFGSAFAWGFHYQVAGYDVYLGEIVITLGIMWLFGMITCYGKRLANVLRIFFATALFLSVLVLFFGIVAKTGFDVMFTPPFAEGGSVVTQITSVVLLGPWMFVGFETVAHSVPEAKINTGKVFTMAALAVVAGMMVYIFMTLIGSCNYPPNYENWSEYVADLNNLTGLEAIPVIYNVKTLLGNGGLAVFGIMVFSALVTGVLGFFRAIIRIIRIMAQEDILPRTFAERYANGVPVKAGYLILLISTPIPFLGRTVIGWTADVSTVATVIVYTYIAVCAVLSARKKTIPGAQVSGVCGVISAVFVVGGLLLPNLFTENILAKESYLILAGWSFLGLVFYWRIFKKDRAHRYGKSTIMWMVTLFVLFFSINVWARLELAEKVDILFQESAVLLDVPIILSSLVQLLIVGVAMIILFKLFSIMLKRERELDNEIAVVAAQNKAKTQFLSNMSHDIRTPMNAIVGFTDLALINPSDEESVKAYLEKIKASGAHLLSLINDVLDMSRIESGKVELVPEPVNLSDAMKNIKTIVIGQIEAKKQELIMSLCIYDENVWCDRLRLNQAMLNLISNAIKYTPEGGRITVRVTQEGEETNGLSSYRFVVSDNGIGMTEEFATRIFEAFEREKKESVNEVQGTGLGMAITKRIVDMMGGDISVKTAPGEGTEFVVNVSLPVIKGDIESIYNYCKDDENISEEEKIASLAKSFEGKRVLLADDMVINRELARVLLEMYGFVVDEAEDGKIAVEMVRDSDAGFYDVVLMDVQMPNMNGYEAAEAIRNLPDKDKSRIPIIAITANAFEEDIKEALNAGMNGHLAKPIDREKMIETIAGLVIKDV
ncbi:MAG: amino acid permease [Lachnospiraceae bacterium]|nr:amino acid permease [Lachnospiraceae bacterium]